MSNFNYNMFQAAGRLTADPTLKTTPNGIAVCQFSIAINRGTKNQENSTDFFNIVAWRNTAEFVSKYFKKGNAIFITGKLQNSKWKDQNGMQHYGVEVVCENAYFVESKSELSSESASSAPELALLDPDQPLPF